MNRSRHPSGAAPRPPASPMATAGVATPEGNDPTLAPALGKKPDDVAEQDPQMAAKKGVEDAGDDQVLFSCNICYDVSPRRRPAAQLPQPASPAGNCSALGGTGGATRHRP